MEAARSIKDIKNIVRSAKIEGKTIGFVPTMGYLHKGHASLIKASNRENDFTVVSIFVNPTQFGPKEDYSTYPRDLERDFKVALESGADAIFIPEVSEMYPEGYKTYVNVEEITGLLCGMSRPGHFKGVTTVVNKFFNIVQPDRAYFGQKDAQQVVVIKKMVSDLNMNLDIVTCPIVREEDGLAMSSRNVYLSPSQRKSALVISKSLFEAEKMIREGQRKKDEVKKYIESKIGSEESADIDYITILEADNLEDIEELSGKILIAAAVRFGKTRLIDNITVEV